MGGFFAVAWTDFFQGLVMVFTLVLLPVLGIILLGGFGSFTQKIATLDPGFLKVGGGSTGWAMMKTVIGGLATSTVLTLVIIPVVYMSFEKFMERLKQRREA